MVSGTTMTVGIVGICEHRILGVSHPQSGRKEVKVGTESLMTGFTVLAQDISSGAASQETKKSLRPLIFAISKLGGNGTAKKTVKDAARPPLKERER